MRGRQAGRVPSPRRSSLSAAVPHATLRRRPDGSYAHSVSEQLTLAIDMPVSGPQLIVTIAPADTVTGMTAQAHTHPGPHPDTGVDGRPEEELAELGEILTQVLDFHEAFDLPREPLPTTHVGDTLAQLRVRLLREETEEFAEATEQRDIVAIADALADVVYVAYGSAITYGIDLDAVLREVHRSNMSKLGPDGRPLLREDGKVLKSDRYRPPDVGKVIDEQLMLFNPDPAPGHPDAGSTAAS